MVEEGPINGISSKTLVVTCEEGKQEERDGSFGLWGSREVVTVEEKQALVNAPTDQLRCRMYTSQRYGPLSN